MIKVLNENKIPLKKAGIVVLLIVMSTIISLFVPVASAQNNLTITTDTSSVQVGVLENVEFKVTRDCGTEPGDVCAAVNPPPIIPASGVTVQLTGAASGSGTTDDNGSVIIPVTATSQGTITATASKTNFTDASVTIQAYAQPKLNITASPSSVNTGISSDIKFSVTEDCQGTDSACTQGSVVPGASVQLTGAFSVDATTGTDGTVTIPVNAGSSGTITATASKDGYSSGTVTIQAGLPSNLNITAYPDTVYIGSPRNVKFTVTEDCPDGADACTQGSVVQGASVQLTGVFSGGATTVADGTVTISINASSQGTITATASKPGFTDGSTTITVDSRPDVIFTVEKNTYFRGEPVNFTLTNTGTATIGPGLWLIFNTSKLGQPINSTQRTSDLAPGESVYFSWNQKDIKGDQVPPWTYKGSATYNNSFIKYTDQFEITSCSLPVNYPPITANSTVGQEMPFKSGNLSKTGKTWNVTWYINGTQVDRETGVTEVSTYTNTSAADGVWDVTAVAESGCDKITWTIIWTVKAACTNTVYDPISVNSTVGQDMPFKSGNLSKTGKTWNVTWYINGTQVDRETGVTQVSAYTNKSAAPGLWNVTAVADSGCDKITWILIWTVNPAPPGCLNIVNTPTTFSSYSGDEVIFRSGNLSNVNKTADGKWNFTWYLNGAAVYNETNVSQSLMKRTGDVGVWNISVIATYDCHKVSWAWVWTVTSKPSSSSGGGSSGGGSSGGGGGGGVTTAEPYTNILKFERQDADLVRSSAVPYTFVSPVFSIYQVLVTGKENEGQIGLRIEHLKETSALVSRMPAGIIYANENLWIGSKRIDSVVLRFRVNNSWITENKLDKTEIMMLRFDNGWKKLSTKEIKSDSTYTYFESGSPGLSSFAVSGIKEGSQDALDVQAQGVDITADAETNNSNPTEKSPGFSIIAGVGIISVAYLIRRKK